MNDKSTIIIMKSALMLLILFSISYITIGKLLPSKALITHTTSAEATLAVENAEVKITESSFVDYFITPSSSVQFISQFIFFTHSVIISSLPREVEFPPPEF